MAIRGTPRNVSFAVAYMSGGKNVTTGVIKGTFRTAAVAPGKWATMIIKVTKVKNAKFGSTRTFAVRVASTRDARKVDTVAAITRAIR